MSRRNDGGKIVGAGLIGAAIGAIAAMLMSPKSGKENRDKMRFWMYRMNKEVKNRVADSKDVTQDKYNQLVDEVSDRYRKMRFIKENELDDFVSDLKERWERIKDQWQS